MPDNARQIVTSYIKALDSLDYNTAGTYLNDSISIKGPTGEAFSNRKDFLDMLQKHQGKYEVKKVFVEGGDVCILYDLITQAAPCSCAPGIRSGTAK